MNSIDHRSEQDPERQRLINHAWNEFWALRAHAVGKDYTILAGRDAFAARLDHVRVWEDEPGSYELVLFSEQKPYIPDEVRITNSLGKWVPAQSSAEYIGSGYRVILRARVV